MSQANVQNGQRPNSVTVPTSRSRTRKPKAAEPMAGAEAVLSSDTSVAEPVADSVQASSTHLTTAEPVAVETATAAVETPMLLPTEAEAESEAEEFRSTAIKLTVEQQTLLRAVERANAAISRKATPVLKNLLLRADVATQTLTVIGYNQRICLECQVDAEVEQGGEFLIASDGLFNLMGRLPDAKLSLDSAAENGWLSLSCTGIDYKERVSNTDNYPELPNLSGEVASNQEYALPAAELSRGLRAVGFAADKDESKLTHSVLLQVWRGDGDGEDGFSLIAASGGNAALYTVTDKTHDLAHPTRQFLLPLQASAAIEKMAFMAGTLQCVCDEAGKMLCFSAEVPQADESTSRISAIIRLREGEFPHVRAALPDRAKASATATLDYLQVTAALSRQEALRTKRVLLKVEFDQVVLQSLGAEGGREMTETLDADTRRTGTIPLGLTPLLAAFRGIESEQVEVQLDSQISNQAKGQVADPEHEFRLLLTFIDTPLQVMSMRVFNADHSLKTGASGAKAAGKGKGKSNKR